MKEKLAEKVIAFGFLFSLAFIAAGNAFEVYSYYYPRDTVSISRATEPPEPLSAPDEFEVGGCTERTFNTSVRIYVLESLGDEETVGRFYTYENAIALKKSHITVSNVAHEVSHLVDQIVYVRGIHDGETRAYLQGYYTNCVWQNVRERTVLF